HFGFHGEPNGWMSKEADLLFMAAIGFGLPLFIIGVCYGTGFLPKSLVNLPNRDYWLAPERRKKTAAHIGGRSVWMACMMVIFLTVLHLLVVFANQRSSPRLSTPGIVSLTACFLAGVFIWVIDLFRDFRKPTGRLQ